MDWFDCLVTVFKWIKYEKREKKTKTENAGKFCKPANIFAGVAKLRNPCEKISQPPTKFRKALASEFYVKLQSDIIFSSELRFARSWTQWKAL